MTSSFWSQLLEGPLGPNVLVVQWVVCTSFEADIEQFDALEMQENPGISCKTTLDGCSDRPRDAIKIGGYYLILHGFSTSPN